MLIDCSDFFLSATFLFLLAPISKCYYSIDRWCSQAVFQVEADQLQLSFSKVELGDYIEEQVEQSKDKDKLDSEIQIFKTL